VRSAASPSARWQSYLVDEPDPDNREHRLKLRVSVKAKARYRERVRLAEVCDCHLYVDRVLGG
jgi:hypothetical protein